MIYYNMVCLNTNMVHNKYGASGKHRVGLLFVPLSTS